LILTQILERGLEFFLDAFVDRVVEDRQRALILIVDIIGASPPS